MKTKLNGDFVPWLIDELVESLEQDQGVLRTLCGPKTNDGTRNRREELLEDLLFRLMSDRFGPLRVALRKPLFRTLRLGSGVFPGTSLADVVLSGDDGFHVCEIKSSRVDYSRFDDVFDSRAFRELLSSRGHQGGAPFEVEQDLIKLRLFHDLSPEVRSCLFLMVDAYPGGGRSWTRVFADASLFKTTMRTALVGSWAEEVVASTRITPLSADGIDGQLILCNVSRLG